MSEHETIGEEQVVTRKGNRITFSDLRSGAGRYGRRAVRPVSLLVAGGVLALAGNEIFANRVLSAPATLTGAVDSEPKPIHTDDVTLDDGTAIHAEPGFEVTLKVCKNEKSYDTDSTQGANNADCTKKVGFLSEQEIIKSGIIDLSVGRVVTVESADFFSGRKVELDR